MAKLRAWASRVGGLLLAVLIALGGVVLYAVSSLAQGAGDSVMEALEPGHRSFLSLPADAPYPLARKVTIGVDKSLLIEVPVDLKNVLVSNPDIIDAVVQTSRQVYLIAKDLGEANAFFFGPDGEKLLLLEVTVNRDLAQLRDAMHRLLPGARVQAEMMGESIVLSGHVATPADANRAADLAARFVNDRDRVLNMLSTNTKEQVLLKITVAEMQRDVMRRIGVDLPGAVLRTGQLTFTKVIQNSFPFTSPAVPIGTAGSILTGNWTSSSGNQSITGLMQALEQAGVVRTLAEPNLTALSGESAKFLAGGEFPIPVSQEDGKVSVEWKPFGVNVSFKPVVLGEGRISLSIAAEVSEIANENSIRLESIALPGLKVRRAETTLELPSGGTLAMAGLLSDDTRQGVEGIPALKNLPVLGALFRSNDYRRRETELVILVTPYLATHAAGRDMGIPGGGFMPQSELKELFFGHINRVYGGPGRPPDDGRYHGDYGFIIEYPDAGLKG